jgi:hypothetical protein
MLQYTTSRQDPECGVADNAEIVGDEIAGILPLLWHDIAQERDQGIWERRELNRAGFAGGSNS